MIYCADFETTVDLEDCRVWAYAIVDIDNVDNIIFGNNISNFIRWCEQAAPAIVYFHNLAFDGSFIIDYIEKKGWKWVENKRKLTKGNYTTLISDMNQVYSITLCFGKKKNIEFRDSLKIIPLSIADMAKAFKLPIQKGTLDYESYREVGHELTLDEKEYISYDVKIAAMSIKPFIEQGLSKLTAGSNALNDYYSILGGHKKFRMIYPYLNELQDTFIRKAYRGGFTYVNPKFQGKKIGEGIVLDVNSLYPSVMYSCDGQLLPYGRPEWFDGKYEQDDSMPLWVGGISCWFKVKPGHIPCIQLKANKMYKQTEYIEDSRGEVTFITTSVDWELIKQQYDLQCVKFLGGYKFHACNFMFKAYVDKWIKVKNQATIEGNMGLRQIAKLMLNSLYGKFATRIKGYSRKPEIIDGVLHYVDLEEEKRNPVYLPVGVFITAHARYKTITSAQSVYDRFIYADTDSLHLLGTDLPDNLDIDAVKLGAWKHESTFYQAKFLRAKCYIEYENDSEKPTIHVAGMPKTCHENVNIDNFEIGAEYDGKLYQHRVEGGIVLVPGKMKIREDGRFVF